MPTPTPPAARSSSTRPSLASPQTITLASTLVLSETAGPEVIDGPGASLVTVSGNNAVEVFSVDSGVTATLTGLTISGGLATQGGGLSVDGGTVSLTNVTVINNQAVGARGRRRRRQRLGRRHLPVRGQPDADRRHHRQQRRARGCGGSRQWWFTCGHGGNRGRWRHLRGGWNRRPEQRRIRVQSSLWWRGGRPRRAGSVRRLPSAGRGIGGRRRNLCGWWIAGREQRRIRIKSSQRWRRRHGGLAAGGGVLCGWWIPCREQRRIRIKSSPPVATQGFSAAPAAPAKAADCLSSVPS